MAIYAQHDEAYVDQLAEGFSQNLKERGITNYFTTKRYCSGKIEMFQIEGKMCTSKGTYYEVYVVWQEEGKDFIKKIDNLSFLVLGVKANFRSYVKNISNKDYNKKYFEKSKLGIALIKEGTGRKVKIFEMLSYGLPVITNLNLEQYGLKNNKHYVLEKRKFKIIKIIKELIVNKRKRNNLSLNAHRWSRKNTYYKFILITGFWGFGGFPN